MGMDIFGCNGGHFRRNVWGWRPLAAYCQHMAPILTARCEQWQSNDGDGLDGNDAAILGAILAETIRDGRAAAYIALRDAELAALSRVPCSYCHALGVRTDEVGVTKRMRDRVIRDTGHPRDGQIGWCNACDGHGSAPDHATNYRLSIEDIEQFAAFLADCNGFEIC